MAAAAPGPGTGITALTSALGTTASCGGEGGGVGGAAAFLLSSEPTSSLGLYFFRMPSLWYFQNCFEASFPATRVRIFLPPVAVLAEHI